ncbi:transcriptional regulator [Aquabacter spiritensis]|uniref:Helix-turn-helix protein n=1 Tax=Aquabacter spiritensis TaxID=933073 RepID=A0A4R3LPL6_9HYPH|nr:transcriptional regulator [Aquabacter spiritensis]TCT02414.1 hypothetical protein EDC64_11361 [Aquabacter spiritensis]
MQFPPVSVRQIAAACALLGLTRSELSARAGVEDAILAGLDRAPPDDILIETLRQTLEAAGVDFIDGGAPGVRLRPPPEGLRADQLNASNDG